MQILIVFVYLVIYCANLYLGMSNYINTSSEINLVMVLTIVLFVLLIAGFVGLGIYELYEKITKVRKRIHDEEE
jgi:choline-glycine betaine transporter